MDFGKFTFRQIDADTPIKSFDCGDADLNDFLFSDAINYYTSMMALTYLLEDNEAEKPWLITACSTTRLFLTLRKRNCGTG